MDPSNRRTKRAWLLLIAWAALLLGMVVTGWGIQFFFVLLALALPAGAVLCVVTVVRLFTGSTARVDRLVNRVVGVVVPILAAVTPWASHVGDIGLWLPVDWVGVLCGAMAGFLALGLTTHGAKRAAGFLVLGELLIVGWFVASRLRSQLGWDPVLNYGETALGSAGGPLSIVGYCLVILSPILGAAAFAVLASLTQRGALRSLFAPAAALVLGLLIFDGLLWHAGVIKPEPAWYGATVSALGGHTTGQAWSQNWP